MALPDLDTKTMPPIKHAERFEFGDDNWIAAAHAFLEPRVAEHANELNGKRLVVQETYPNAPPHLNQPDNILNLHYIFDSSALTLGHGPVDNPTIHMQADYNLGHIVNATVYEVIPGRQARIMRELNHPHVVRLHEVFYARRNIYLVMELASGGELFDLLTSQPGDRFSEPFAADLMAQMLSAVNTTSLVAVTQRFLPTVFSLMLEKLTKL